MSSNIPIEKIVLNETVYRILEETGTDMSQFSRNEPLPSNPKASYTVEDVRESARGWVGHSTTDTAIGEEILAHRALWAADEIERLRDRVHSEEFVTMFLGYLTAKLPELHKVEAPRVMDAWNEFKREMGKRP